jgi:hypothetical protein
MRRKAFQAPPKAAPKAARKTKKAPQTHRGKRIPRPVRGAGHIEKSLKKDKKDAKKAVNQRLSAARPAKGLDRVF